MSIFIFIYIMPFSRCTQNFIILKQLVAEKTLTKNVNMCYIGVTKGKVEKRRQNEDQHLNFHLHNTLCLPEGVYKIP